MKSLLAALVFSVALPAVAQPAPAKVERAWARSTVQGQDSTGAYMTLTASEPLTLLGAATPAAGIVEIHQMKMEGDIMKMRAVDALPLKPGAPLLFAPNGYHFMLMDLKAPFRAGGSIRMTLRFRDAKGAERTQDVTVPVALAAPGGHGH
ncbi:copper chaperone PCu(A)C [Ramlibacter sp. PS3R-8]|uniref:copper chaperone PCu(A)C n=1 Tax=Ramlibacter sp. PS3R-8 TaxID=3133437 RepID=UPI0030A49A43